MKNALAPSPMRRTILPFSRPIIGEHEIAEVVDTLCSDSLATASKVTRFEHEFALAVDAPAALALNSGTAALHLALVTLGIGSGDSVITTPMAFVATVNAIEQAGARALLVDVEPGTFNIDAWQVGKIAQEQEKFRGGNEKLKAILPVHLHGHPCEMAPLLEIARRHGLAVIEDAAHALPAGYHGRPIGSQLASASVPLLTCFSFSATSSLTTGEGGMLTGLPETVAEARLWSLNGMRRDQWNAYGEEEFWRYEVVRPGFNYAMTDLQASIGIHQLARQPQFQARRAEIAHRYTAAFSELDCVQVPLNFGHVDHAWHIYALRLWLEHFEISRDRFMQELAARNISSSVDILPVHLHSFYRDKYGYKPDDFPVAFRESQRVVSLPIYAGMKDHDVDDVIDAVSVIARTFARARRTIPASPVIPGSSRLPLRHVSPPAPEIGAAMRRMFDFICAAAGLLVMSPLFVLIAAAIKWDDGGPVFYRQMRVGRDFRPFRLIKFRSMAVDSPSSSPIAGPGDPRVTRVGRFLRDHKLDEFPQLLNVLRGDMQMVGVRPQLERYVRVFPEEYRALLQDRPGITDPASLEFRNEEQMFGPGSLDEQYLTRILPAKLRLALKYRQARTFLSDLGIVFRTLLGLKSPTLD
jgi:dTDP-4-amino-4,6-dideoxygalactose transaminase/lipopolysaccharide/colanic/teichoic acid biosynthesis glycosyltransferase